ncbi:MAG: alpha/beta fold hydrolase [Ilumatobacter sp.]|nr:lysophospholipase [bacterium]NKB42417.1 alpha/beta fold hydrolase [Ilumatobacter sp.]
MITSTTETATTADGLAQLRRRWVPAGPPHAAMLIVHGIGEHSGRYEHVGGHFADAGIDVLSYDQRGFGESGGHRGHVERFDEFLDDAEVLLSERRSLNVPTILLGHSLGGLVSSSYLVSKRPQPDLAVLSAPALDAELPSWQRFAAPALGTIVPRLRIPADFDGSVLTRDEAVQTAYETDPLRVPASTARLGRETLRTMKHVQMTLDRLRIPTYVLHGSDDTLVPPAASESLASLPNVTRQIWDGLRHECMNEPEHAEVIAEIITWINAQLDV